MPDRTTDLMPTDADLAAFAHLSTEEMLAAALGGFVSMQRDLDRLHQLALDGRFPMPDGLQDARHCTAECIDALCGELRPGEPS